jgi:hypothetical protein
MSDCRIPDHLQLRRRPPDVDAPPETTFGGRGMAAATLDALQRERAALAAQEAALAERAARWNRALSRRLLWWGCFLLHLHETAAALDAREAAVAAREAELARWEEETR